MKLAIQLIKAGEYGTWVLPETGKYLNVSEFFCDTIQGENFVGYPAAFLRLQDCTLNCSWCDTKEVWRQGRPYSFAELFELMDNFHLIAKLNQGQHLVLTGGSPLLQQESLVNFLDAFNDRYQFLPYIEVENECMIKPNSDMIQLVDLWNNSPKLQNSGNHPSLCHRPDIIKATAIIKNSWFKFVISSPEDWDEIQSNYLDTNLIHRSQIVLMPLGDTREELEKHRLTTVEMAIKHNMRYSTREHIVLWDKKTGI